MLNNEDNQVHAFLSCSIEINAEKRTEIILVHVESLHNAVSVSKNYLTLSTKSPGHVLLSLTRKRPGLLPISILSAVARSIRP